MKLVIYKNPTDTTPVELEVSKLYLYDITGQPIAVALEINKDHIAIAHSGDDDFIPILMQSGYRGPLPKHIRLKQTNQGLIVPG
jgi:hypothetical protein